MIASFAAELLKLRKRPAVWVLGVLLLSVLVTFGYLLSYLILSFPPPGLATSGVTPAELKRSLYPENLVPNVLSMVNGLGGTLVLILGALSSGSEYGWETVKTMLTQRPTRLGILGGKLLALGLTVLLLVLALFVVGTVCSLVIALLDQATIAWPPAGEVVRALGAAWLVLALWTSIGFALATLFRGTALAIGLGLVYMLVLEGIVGGIFGQVEIIRTIRQALPGSNAGALTGSFRSTLATGPQLPALVGPGRATVVLLAYLAGAVLLAVGLFQRRDVV